MNYRRKHFDCSFILAHRRRDARDALDRHSIPRSFTLYAHSPAFPPDCSVSI